MSNAKQAETTANKDDGKSADQVAKKSFLANKKPIIIAAVAGLLFIGLMAGGTLFLLKSLSADDPEAALHTQEHSKDAVSPEAHESVTDEHGEKKGGEHGSEKNAEIYIALTPAFLVNFQGVDGQHFLQVEVSLLTHDVEVEHAAQLHMPLIRNALVMLYGAQSISSLSTAEGKESLRRQSLEAVQKIFKKEIGKDGIEDIFFTNLVMQ